MCVWGGGGREIERGQRVLKTNVLWRGWVESDGYSKQTLFLWSNFRFMEAERIFKANTFYGQRDTDGREVGGKY